MLQKLNPKEPKSEVQKNSLPNLQKLNRSLIRKNPLRTLLRKTSQRPMKLPLQMTVLLRLRNLPPKSL